MTTEDGRSHVLEFEDLIGAESVDVSDASRFENRSPATPDTVLGTFPSPTRRDTQRAIAVARAALPAWKDTPAPARGTIIEPASQLSTARRDEIARALTREEGRSFLNRLWPII